MVHSALNRPHRPSHGLAGSSSTAWRIGHAAGVTVRVQGGTAEAGVRSGPAAQRVRRVVQSQVEVTAGISCCCDSDDGVSLSCQGGAVAVQPSVAPSI